MKRISLLLFAIPCLLFAQSSKKSCSASTKKSKFAMLTAKADFRDAHTAPLPFDFKAENGEMVSYKTSDGGTSKAFVIKAAKPTKKVLFVLHEWWGLNDYIKKEAEQYAKDLEGVDVIALDLYDGKVATDPVEAGKLMGGLDGKHAMAIVNGAISTFAAKSEIATIGWCMGGRWSFNTAVAAKNQVKACVMYYGFPETDNKKIKAIQSKILYIQGTKDAFIPTTAVEKLSVDLKSAGKVIIIEKYEAEHAFANPSNPNHNKEFSADARAKCLAFIKKELKL